MLSPFSLEEVEDVGVAATWCLRKSAASRSAAAFSWAVSSRTTSSLSLK